MPKQLGLCDCEVSMQDSVHILSKINEWTVFQQTDGYTQISLFGTAEVSGEHNYPVISVVDTNSEKYVVHEKLHLDGTSWQCEIKLKTGMYRIETGIALETANYNPLYLARGDMIDHLFVGEVFMIAGQSNAVGYGKDEVCDMPQYGVCKYTDKWGIASHPIGRMNDGAPNMDFLNCGHSPWLSFGKMLLNNQKTPVGLVPAALNGSSIKMWDEGTPLFENMIEKAKITGAKNLIWYQGCTDTDTPEDYEQRLDKLVCNIKERLGSVEIYIVQISGTTNDAREDIGWSIVREVQRSVAQKYKMHLIVTYDLVNYTDDIHLGSNDNLELAKRAYEHHMQNKLISSIMVSKSKNIELTFVGAEALDSDSIDNIVALGSDEKEVDFHFEVKRSKVIIISENIKKIRYLTLPFGRLYNGRTLKDKQGNCVPYFRIDLEKL